VLFRVLGTMEAGADGAAAELGPPKQRAVLAILLMHVGEIVPTERLIDLLWGDRPPRTAAHSIQIYVSELRKALEPFAAGGTIGTRPPGYVLEADPDSIDARRFERLVVAGVRQLQDGDRAAGAATLRSAIALWRGPALSDFVYEEFAQPYIRRLHDLHLDAIEELAAAELEADRATEVLPLLDLAIREDPLRERSRELLMLALYRVGRHAEALRTYATLRTQLEEELGLDPSPQLQRMQERILLHDPSLALRGDAPAASTGDRNPYKGLRAFTERDAPDYFGRDALVQQLLDALAGGARMIALVGPSGSGKSSVLAAGLIPSIREGRVAGSDRWLIAPIVPGARPLQDLEAVVAKAARQPVGLAQLLGGAGTAPAGAGLRTMPDDGRLVIVIDQFEDVFAVADEPVTRGLLHALASAVKEPDGQVIVLLALRADFYDRPLMHPEFAEVFLPAVVNVLPMVASELEAAVVRPAERVGVAIEPALLAELVAETADRSGALPMLQYALTELFDQRTSGSLTHAGYRALGGLRGIVSRRAEALYTALPADQQRVAMQAFLRLVRSGQGVNDSRRRVPLLDLMDLGVDPVALSDVLAAFGRSRMLAFDRDPVSGAAIVEVGHEALLREWERLATWIERHRTALRRYETFASAVDEWESSGRQPDYLLTGSRLVEFETWAGEGTLRITGREQEYLVAGIARRTHEEASRRERAEAERKLERRARRRLVALAVAVGVTVGTVGYAVWAIGQATVPRVAILQSGSAPIQQQSEAGFDRAITEFGLIGQEVLFDQREDGSAEMRHLAADGADLIIQTQGTPGDFDTIAAAFPNTRFAVPYGPWMFGAPNVVWVLFAEQDAAFLAGAAAALTSTTGRIGFIGGLDDWFMWTFHAGYEAGARAIDPTIEVEVRYLAVPPPDGPPDYAAAFNNRLGGRDAARALYAQGVDVIFQAAGGSGIGVWGAAVERPSSEHHVWVIGADEDQYTIVEFLPGVIDSDDWRRHMLTSVVKHVDLSAYEVIERFARGAFVPGIRVFGLDSGAVELAYSGGYLDAHRTRIEQLRAEIIAGTIVVPCIPPDKERDARARLGDFRKRLRDDGCPIERP
jgi:basic membrane lipoprotein Med (substrate-binding protein (PBP1-ABC) superfamily)/DNA-binding SARP family transcriptional activator